MCVLDGPFLIVTDAQQYCRNSVPHNVVYLLIFALSIKSLGNKTENDDILVISVAISQPKC